MKLKTPRGYLTLVFFLFAIVLTVALFIGLRKEMEAVEWEFYTPKSAWKAIVREGLLDKELGLKFVRSSRIFTRVAYEFLYHRKYPPEQISEEVVTFLGKRGIEVGRIVISEISGDIKIQLTSDHVTFAEVIMTPDMSTSAGKICIIIDDFGYNLNEAVKGFLNLDVPLTFAVLPGHTYSRRVAALADGAGFEVMVHMPMESKDYRAGEDEFVLNTTFSRQEIAERLRSALVELPQAKGISNHQGSSATESRRVMRVVAEVLRSERKYFVDSKTSAESVAVSEMERAGVPVAERSVFIDYEDDEEIVREQVTLLAKKARRNGVAIGVGHPRRITLEVLSKMIPQLQWDGFDLVFASAVVK